MEKVRKNKRNNLKNFKGITLVALVVTIIILLILAGISIATLTGSGLFEKARLAEQKSKESQELEEQRLADYQNKINDYISNTRQESNSSKMKSLINKDDGVFDKSNDGYIFEISTAAVNYTSNNTIHFTETIENYDVLLFEIDLKHNTKNNFRFTNTYTVVVNKILSLNNSSDNPISITNSYGDVWGRVYAYFKDANNLVITQGQASDTWENALRIIDIYGIKY